MLNAEEFKGINTMKIKDERDAFWEGCVKGEIEKIPPMNDDEWAESVAQNLKRQKKMRGDKLIHFLEKSDKISMEKIKDYADKDKDGNKFNSN
jgi:hypothetical protein